MPLLLRLLITSCMIVFFLPISAQPADTSPPPGESIIRFNVSPKGYPPFTIIHDDGSHSGIVWDLLTLVAKRHGYAVEGLEIPRKRVDDFILEGRVDATGRAMEWTEEPERFLFTEPLLVVEEVFFKRVGTRFRFSGLDAIKGKTVLTTLGYQYPRLDPLFEQGLAVRFDVTHQADMLQYLLAGTRFELAVAVLQVGLWHIRQQGWQGQLDYSPEPLAEQGYRLMFSTSHQPFVTLFNQELKKMKASGELETILDRYR